jgi:hypothetical protein
MSLDQRVRDALERSSAIADPDIRRNLARARRRGRRLVVARRVGTAILVVVIAVIVALAPRMIGGGDRVVPDEPRPPTGELVSRVPDARGVVRTYGLAGRWTLSFLDRGRLLFSAPPSASVRQLRPAYTYAISGRVLSTDLFVHDVCAGTGTGTYRWSGSLGTATFTVASDRCPVRVAVMTSASWASTTSVGADPLEGTWLAAGITCRQAVDAEARAGFGRRELEIASHGWLADVARCARQGPTRSDVTYVFRDGRFQMLGGTPADGRVGYNGTYRLVGPDRVIVSDGYSAPTFRFSIDGDELTLDVVRLQLVQPGMTRRNRLEDWVSLVFGAESKPFTRVP